MRVHTHNHNRGFVLMMVVVTLFLITAVALWMGRDSGMGLNLAASQQQQQQARQAAEAGLAHASWQVNAGNCDNYTSVPSTALVGGATYEATVTPSSGSPVTLTSKGQAGAGALASLSERRSVYSPPVTLELAPVKDAKIQNSPANANYGNDPELRVEGGVARSLLQFDMPAFADTPEILSAVLKLDHLSSWGTGVLNLELHPLTAEWAEMQATYNVRQTSVPWSTPGGDYSSSATATAAIDLGVLGIKQIDMTRQVAAWIGGEPNLGFIMRTPNGKEMVAASNEHATAVAPVLEITYRCECGLDCGTSPSCNADYGPNSVVYSHDLGAQGLSGLSALTYIPQGEVIGGETVPAEGWLLALNSKNATLARLSPASGFLGSVDLAGLTGAQGMTWASSGNWANHLLIVNNNGGEVHVYDGGLSPVTNLGRPLTVSKIFGISHIAGSASGTYDGDLLLVGTYSLFGSDDFYVWIVGQNMLVKATLALAIGKPTGVAHLPGTDKMLISYGDNQYLQILDFDGNEHWRDASTGLGMPVPDGVAVDTASCQQVIGDASVDTVSGLEYVPLLPEQPCFRYADDFSTQNYSGSSGETDWSDTPWLELGESDGPAIGEVYMMVSKGKNWLVISGPDNGVERAVNLDNAGPATLNITAAWDKFDDAADKVTLEISSDAGASWHPLHEFADIGPKVPQLHTFTITDYASADTRIRLVSSSGLGADDLFKIQGPVEVDACFSVVAF